MESDVLWSPSEDAKRGSSLWAFAVATAPLHAADPGDYPALHAWSIRSPADFYAALWDHLRIVGERGDVAFVRGETLCDTAFFPNASLNYAENALWRRDDAAAIIAHRNDGSRRQITWAELYDAVSRFAQALIAEGVRPGDRVAAIVTHDIEAIVGFLATAAIGAVWSSCSPDFGPSGAADRLCQIDPTVLLAVPEYDYAGKRVDVMPTIRAVAESSALRRIVLAGEVPASGRDLPFVAIDDWTSAVAPAEIAFVRQPFAAPLAILYSSGTTGKPKCIIHSVGGVLLQHKKEQMLHCDIRPSERFFYYTTAGWMMWNWHVSGLALGATLVTYDGNPFHPSRGRLIDLIERERIAVFGTSAKYIDACAKAGLQPRESHDLTSLRLILSTGSPLLPASFDYIYRDWKSDLQLSSVSGGTDICGCFLGSNPLLPVRRGELQAAMLGMDLDTLDDRGQPVRGVPGELVCRSAHPSMPVGFFGDADGSRYREAYFDRFPGVWTHGDFAEIRDGGGFIIHGRSDTTLNPGGVRIGTAELYRQIEPLQDIEEAVAVGQQWEGDQRVVLFVRLRGGATLTDALQDLIRRRIRSGATPRHVPARIVAVSDFPRTRSGKVSEAAVRDTINGRKLTNLDSLSNPELVETFVDLPELRN